MTTDFDIVWCERFLDYIRTKLEAKRELLLRHYGKVEYTEKADQTIVTELDTEMESYIRTTLREYESSIGIVGEEYPAEGSEENYWLVDPIDGTELFVRGMPYPCTMLTLVSGNEPVFCVLWQFVANDFYHAVKNAGAYKNMNRLSASSRPLNRSWIELSVPLNNKDNLELVCQVRDKIAGYTTTRNLFHVADARLEGALVIGGGGDWDYAPRTLLYKEAGLVVSNFGKDVLEPIYNFRNHQFLVATPEVFAELFPVIQDVYKNKKLEETI